LVFSTKNRIHIYLYPDFGIYNLKLIKFIPPQFEVAHYHICRMCLLALYKHANIFKDEVETLNNWYTN